MKKNYNNVFLYRFLPLVILLLGMSVSVKAQVFHLTTENYPPFNMDNGEGKVVGISTEIVEELFSRASVSYELQLLPWQRAYGNALDNKNYAVFSTTRTPDREKLFKWVGPIVENNWVLLKRKGSPSVLNKLDDAKNYTVGAYHGDAISVYLAEQGFNVENVAKDQLNVQKLKRGRIDLWATGHLLGPYYARQQHVEGFEPALVFRKTIMSIAFNKSVSDGVIDKLNKELKKMSTEGVTDKIKLKYQ